MHSNLDVCLALLLGLWVGAAGGVFAIGLFRGAKQSTQVETFRVPAAHREYEHECDAPYPRIND